MRTVLTIIALLNFLAAPIALAQDGPQAIERVQQGNLIMEGIPEIPESVADRIEQYQNTRPVAFRDWGPDGGMLITTRFGETSQVHLVASPMGMRRQLTFHEEPIAAALSRPGHNQFVFQKDIGGNEQYQFYLYDIESGEETLLTDPEIRNDAMVMAADGRVIAWSHPLGDTGDYAIAVADLSDPESRRTVYEGEGAWWPTDISPNGGRAIIRKYVSISEGELALLDLATGEATPINPSEEVIAYGEGNFSADGRYVLYISNEGSDFSNLVRYDIATGEKTVLTADINWDVESFDVAPNAAQAVFAINAGGVSQVGIIDTNTGASILAPELPTGVITGLSYSEDGARVGLTIDGATSPDNAYAFDVATGAVTQWTDGEVGGLDTSGFRDAELVSFESFDGLEVPAFVFRPEGEGPHPVMLYLHGGPESQYRPRFSSNIQFWVNELGVAFVAPNVRGSSGYGTTYVGLDNGYGREDSVRDVGAALDWIATQDDLDADRVLVYGGSYGGYMVLASLVHYDDRLAGGVDVVGISNFVTFLENTEGYRRDLRRPEYGDERDPEMRAFLESISPSNRADEITSPLFIIQGLNDPRVPASEAEQMLAAVRANGGDAWYLLATDEGHGFRKKSNRDFQYQAVALFLERHLVGEGD